MPTGQASLQAMQAKLALYAVPVTGFDHHWGISQSPENTKINYFGREVYRNDVLLENRKRFLQKWFGSPPAPPPAAFTR